jgi:hypothetical protein
MVLNSWLLLAGTTDPPVKASKKRMRDGKRTYLEGQGSDMSNMENWARGTDGNSFWDYYRDMNDGTCEVVPINAMSPACF